MQDATIDAAGLVTRMESSSALCRRGRRTELPADLLHDSARRLRVIALIYAAGFLIGEFAYGYFDPVARRDYAQFYGWGPPAISIVVALIVAGLASSRRIPAKTLMHIGLVFEVVGAYGIAFAAYWGVYQNLEYEAAHLAVFGLSYVAPWIMFFTIVSPNEPRKALWAAVAAGSAVPVVLVLTTTLGSTSIVLTLPFVINAMLVPWLLIVVTAYVGARVVYQLGTAVAHARELGSYRLLERLGQGGMGEVWRAKHRLLVRPAAIKLIRPEVQGHARDGSTLQRRFEREAQATALMRSQHTIDVYDFGVATDGTFYYVMELLRGFDLDTLVRQFGPVRPERVVYLLRQVCESLAEAHEHALIHRDIKPANIYLCRQGRLVDFVKVLDFGLVKLPDDLTPDHVAVTADQMLGGTPAFMAPEQASGEPVDARSDLYALGCVAYWLLTGRFLFGAKTAVEMMVNQVHKRPEPFATVVDQPIPQELEAAVFACLEKDPNDRPQSADEFDALLAAVRTDQPWTPDEARAWWDAHQPMPTGEPESAERQAALV